MSKSMRVELAAVVVVAAAMMATPGYAVTAVAEGDVVVEACDGLGGLLDELLKKDKDKPAEEPKPEEPGAAPAPAAPAGGEGVADAERGRHGGVPYEDVAEADRHRIKLLTPTGETRWEHGERDKVWQWDPATVNGKVRFELWRGRRRVAEIKPPVENDGAARLTEPVYEKWGTGTNFYIVAIDGKGRIGVSEPFTIFAGVLVTRPYEATVWQAGDKDAAVRWDPATVKGNRVKFELWKGDKMVEEFHPMTDNDGEEQRGRALPDEWAAGDDYRIRAVDAKGRSGFSDYFKINSGVTVLYPDAKTVWRYPAAGETVRWDAGSVRGGKVKFEMWKGDAKVGEFVRSDDNSGAAKRERAIDPAWGQGDDFRIKAIDAKGKEGFSAKFTITAEIEVEKPDRGTVFVLGEKKAGAAWKQGTASGEVRFELWSADKTKKIADYLGPVQNDGRAFREGGFDFAIEPGEYRLKAIDANGFTGWSEAFKVKAAKS